MYTVWCGGVEVNDHYMARDKADELAKEYLEDGYDDVSIEPVML